MTTSLSRSPPVQGAQLLNALAVSVIRQRPALATCTALVAGYLVGRLVLR